MEDGKTSVFSHLPFAISHQAALFQRPGSGRKPGCATPKNPKNPRTREPSWQPEAGSRKLEMGSCNPKVSRAKLASLRYNPARRGITMAESDQTKPAEAAGAKPTGMTRRSFVTTAAAAGAGVVIVPRHVLGRGMQAPSDTVNVAIVGIGGMGGSNARALMSQNIVAICDVDDAYSNKKLEEYKTTLARMTSGAGGGGGGQGNQTPPKLTQAQVTANQRRPA